MTTPATEPSAAGEAAAAPHPRILVAVGDDDAVALVAAELAQRLRTELVFVAIDETRYTTTDRDGDPVELPIDPDGADDAPPPAHSLETRLQQVLPEGTPRWTLRVATGEPASALAQIADDLDAALIVVGASGHGVGDRVRDLVTGSIADHLIRNQRRPVLVVPRNATALFDDGLRCRAHHDSADR